MKETERRVLRAMSTHYSVISKDQALRMGMTRHEIECRVASGDWTALHRGIYRASGAESSPRQELFAACLAAGPLSAASHQSAAWMWEMMPNPPARHVITVPRGTRPRVAGTQIYRSRDFDTSRTVEHHLIPCTDPLRVATDLAAVMPPDLFAPVVDSALHKKLLSTKALRAEIARRSAPGRPGPAALRRMLEDRGMIGGPEPSVLEAEAMRLFERARIPVLLREVRAGPDGQYRIDFLIGPGLVVEVDGFAFHWTPEAKARDDTRRNQLRLGGMFVLVYNWRDIRHDARRVAAEIMRAIAQCNRRAG